MPDHYTLLGISFEATPTEIKAAYHQKLKEFPAHQHPQEFKAIRTAYEAIRQKAQSNSEDFLKIMPTKVELSPKLLQDLREKAVAETNVSLEELMQLTF
jgi:DnaJ domain